MSCRRSLLPHINTIGTRASARCFEPVECCEDGMCRGLCMHECWNVWWVVVHHRHFPPLQASAKIVKPLTFLCVTSLHTRLWLVFKHKFFRERKQRWFVMLELHPAWNKSVSCMLETFFFFPCHLNHCLFLCNNYDHWINSCYCFCVGSIVLLQYLLTAWMPFSCFDSWLKGFFNSCLIPLLHCSNFSSLCSVFWVAWLFLRNYPAVAVCLVTSTFM